MKCSKYLEVSGVMTLDGTVSGDGVIPISNGGTGSSTGFSDLEAQVQGLSSGAPKAVSLVSQMTNHALNYVYVGSEAGYTNGNWYYWNGTAWVSGGVYQSAGLADGSVTNAKINARVKYGTVAVRKPIELSRKSGTLTINATSVWTGSDTYNVAQSLYTFPINLTAGGNYFLWYSTDTKTISLGSYVQGDTKVLLGYVSISTSVTWDFHGTASISDMDTNSTAFVNRDAIVYAQNAVEIDTLNKTIDFTTSTLINVFYFGSVVTIPQSGLSEITAQFPVSHFWINMTTNSVVETDDTNYGDFDLNYVYLGFIKWTDPYHNYLRFNHTIDGINFKNQSIADKVSSVYSQKPVEIDEVNQTLTIKSPNIFVNWLGVFNEITIDDNDGAPIDISSNLNTFLYLDVASKSIVKNSTGIQPSGSIYLGYIVWNNLQYDFKFPIVFVGQKNNNVTPNKYTTKYANKKTFFIGDSITWSKNPIKWSDLVGKYLQSTVIRDGVSGSTFAVRNGHTDSAVERIDNVTGMDLIVIWFGVNDFGLNVPLGTHGSTDTSTLYGAVEYVLNTAITNNPDANIMVITPYKQDGFTATWPGSFDQNGQGLVQQDYVDVIKELASKYSLNVLDMWEKSGMSPYIPVQKQMYLDDGLHPNQAGEYRVARKVYNFIESEM